MRSYDNPHWEFHLPINPPINPGTDIDVNGDTYVYDFNGNDVSILNWDDEGYTFQPRIRDRVQTVSRFTGFRLVTDDEAPEIDDDWGYDCD